MFHARLQVAFRGLPWEESVRAKEYYVLTHDYLVINPRYWTNTVSPRSKLRMFVSLQEEITDNGICLQPASITRRGRIWVADVALGLPRHGGREEYIERIWRNRIYAGTEYPWFRRVWTEVVCSARMGSEPAKRKSGRKEVHTMSVGDGYLSPKYAVMKALYFVFNMYCKASSG